MPKVDVAYFFHRHSPQITYVVTDVATRQSAVINPVMTFRQEGPDFDQVDEAIKYLDANNLSLDWILDTHFDPYQYLAGRYLQHKLGGVRGIGETAKRSIQVSSEADSSAFVYDEYFLDGELFLLGHIQTEVVWVPGYMPCCVSYVISNCIFSGNCLNLPEEGVTHSASSPSNLSTHYESIHKLFAFPNDYKFYVGTIYKNERYQNERYQSDRTIHQTDRATHHSDRALFKEPSCSVLEQKRCNKASKLTLNLDGFSNSLDHSSTFDLADTIACRCTQIAPYLSQYNG